MANYSCFFDSMRAYHKANSWSLLVPSQCLQSPAPSGFKPLGVKS